MDKSSFEALKILDDESDNWDKDSREGLSGHIMDNKRYDIQDLIAKGGMKEVYKAFDRQNNRLIALAKLRPDVKDEQSEDFLKEAYLTANLEHPNIISLYDIGVDIDGYPMFTMELKVGDTLSDILRERHKGNEKYLEKFPLQKRLDIFLKICDAIDYAHSQEILHLDIKPDNIQVGTFGEVQVCDWGLGTKIENANNPKDPDIVKGTPGYMAPEQINPDLDIGYHSDIYSLGALLYTLLTDKEPLSGGQMTLMKKTISGDVPDPRDLCPDLKISESLNAVVNKAMSVDIEDRYKSVKDLKTEVEYYLSGRSTEAENAGFIKEARLFYKRNSMVCIIFLLSLLSIFSVSTFFLLKQKQSNLELQASNKETKKALDESNKNYELYKDKVETEKKLINELLRKDYTEDYLKFEGTEFFSKKTNKLNHTANDLLKHHEALPENRTVIRKTIEALFILQRFDEILDFENISSSPFINIAREFSKIKEKRKGLLMSKDFLRFIQEINKLETVTAQNFMERVIYVYQARKDRALADPSIIKELIKCWNKDWDSNNFEYEQNGHTLKIWGKNLKYLKGNGKYSSHLSFLRYLKINHLILSKSKVNNLHQISNLNIRTLDITDTEITNTSEIKLLPDLSRLIVRKNQLSAKVTQIPKRIIVEEK